MIAKSIKFKKKTITITLESKYNKNSNKEIKKAIALGLLCGLYNPIRKYSNSDNPIDIKSLRDYRYDYEFLVEEIIRKLNIDITNIEDLSMNPIDTQ